MSPLRRRSSRLRGSNVTPSKRASMSRRMSTLAGGEEAPQNIQSTLTSIGEQATAPQTPATAPRIKPTFQDMHPGKGHSASSPTFDYRDATTPVTTGRIRPHFEKMHPGKGHSTATSSFDFKFARPADELGPEAQKMRDDLREETLRIRVKLAAEREKEMRNEEKGAAASPPGRKIAMPKGKVGRFSDAHMSQFKKMDSIAGHASAYRAQPGRFQTATTTATRSLKRSQSKAKLNDREEDERSSSMALNTVTETASEDGTPAKRARVTKSQHEVPLVQTEPESLKRLSRSRSVLASLTTPTQASLARVHATKIPGISQSPSKQNLNLPRGLPKSVTMGNLSSLKRSDSSHIIVKTPSRLERVKSILRRPTANPEKLTASTSPATNLKKPNLNKELPSMPRTPLHGKMATFNFAPRSININTANVQTTPSPYKSGIPRSKSTMNVDTSINYPSLASIMNTPAKEVTYPSLIEVQPLPKSRHELLKIAETTPSVPGTFAFRADRTISFGTSPRAFGSSPGQSSVRQVRSSILPLFMPGTFPTYTRDSNKENKESILSIPRGMQNKKRRRADSSDESGDDVPERSPKKHKGPTGVESPKKFERGQVREAMEREISAPKSRIPSPTKRAVLKISRLNMLARPKMRK